MKHVFELWQEARVPRKIPSKHNKNMQTQHINICDSKQGLLAMRPEC